MNSRKYTPECMPMPEVLLPVLVTGLGGGGTHFMTRVLRQECGLKMHHEGLGIHGAVVRKKGRKEL